MTKKNNNDMMKLTEVVSSLRGATLAWQVLCSLVAFSALAQRDALTGEAQITGLSVYLALFVGAAGGRPPLVTSAADVRSPRLKKKKKALYKHWSIVYTCCLRTIRSAFGGVG